MQFTYRTGDRPLEGYTIKRGVGQGGFGEVYYAVSDSGKEVALKLLRGQIDAERRGIAECLNLKHPNLLHIYDLRRTPRGESWVVMEYVFGESLAQILERHPNGLPHELIREWFAAICRGVGFLHDMGVIHRDLKPANIFIENGHLKIGDYGLARRISGSDYQAVTSGVGTPHYMAPELKHGHYGRSVDIYACGIILYEMLVGHPPFTGDNPVDILLRHQTDTPDLSVIPPPLRPVLERALHKDPQQRYASMGELGRAVEAAFASGSTAGQRASTRNGQDRAAAPTVIGPTRPNLANGQGGGSPEPPVIVPLPPSPPLPAPPRASLRERVADWFRAAALAPLICLACTLPWLLLREITPWAVLAKLFVLATAASWCVLLLGIWPPPRTATHWGRRSLHFSFGCLLGLLAVWLDGWALPRGQHFPDSRDLVLPSGQRISPELLTVVIRAMLYYGLVLAAVRWWRMTEPHRRERFRIGPVVETAFFAGLFLFLWVWETTPVILGLAPPVIAAIAVQLTAAWRPASRSGTPALRLAPGIRGEHLPLRI